MPVDEDRRSEPCKLFHIAMAALTQVQLRRLSGLAGWMTLRSHPKWMSMRLAPVWYGALSQLALAQVQ